jgi:hypothetical protein
MRLVTVGSSKSLSSEVVVDLHEYRFPVIGKHEVKSRHIYAGAITEAEHRRRSLFSQLWPPRMVKPSSPTYIVVELTAANTEVSDRMTAIDYDPQVFPPMFHPPLDQRWLTGWKPVDVLGKVSRLVYGENKASATS